MLNTEIPITLETIVQKDSKSLLITEIGDELVMMDIVKGNYISLNKIGRIIWNQIGDPISVNNLINLLVSSYNVQKEECINDTLEYLRKMQVQNIISVK